MCYFFNLLLLILWLLQAAKGGALLQMSWCELSFLASQSICGYYVFIAEVTLLNLSVDCISEWLMLDF